VSFDLERLHRIELPIEMRAEQEAHGLARVTIPSIPRALRGFAL
jgi:hypothetical protein